MWQFIKKHWKSLLAGAAVVLAFIGGLLTGRRPGTGLFDGGQRNSGNLSENKAKLAKNGQRIEDHIDEIGSEIGGASSDNRQASGKIDEIRNENSQLEKIASELAKIAGSDDCVPGK